MATMICNFHQNGFCKFKENCHIMHVNELCSRKDCPRVNCQLRHPRSCRYFLAYGACKFENNCSYLHDRSVIDEILCLKEDMQSITAKINHIIKTIEDLTKQTSYSRQPSQIGPSLNKFSSRITPDSPVDENLSSMQDDTIPQLDGAVYAASSPENFPFTCNTCNEGFTEPDDFMIHDSYPYRCEECGICFPVKLAADLHIHRGRT